MFLTDMFRFSPGELPLFSAHALPVFPLAAPQAAEVAGIFEQMIAEVQGEYVYKYELVKNAVARLLYTAMKQLPPQNLLLQQDAASRITLRFFDLLEQQFPLSVTSGPFRLRSANDVAGRLAVHVNYLNRVLKKTTGKTTTGHIAERLAAEAVALLKHSNSDIAEIAFVLGFDDPAHFTRFFKKQTGAAPSAFRTV